MAEVSIAEEASKYKDLCEEKYELARRYYKKLEHFRLTNDNE